MEISFIYLFSAGILGGLLLNFMPCILPVISLKILSFIRLAKESRIEILKHGLLYSFGIIISFMVLAGIIILVQSLGGMAGWGFQFQSPLFCWIMAASMALLGLNAWGVGTFLLLKLKSRIQSRYRLPTLGGWLFKLKEKSKYLSSFTHGLLTTVLGSVCCGPFLGYVMGMSFMLSWPVTLAVFAFIGIGMSLPYLLCSIFPSSIRWIPKGGKWLRWVEWIAGGLMFATAGWFIYLAL